MMNLSNYSQHLYVHDHDSIEPHGSTFFRLGVPVGCSCLCGHPRSASCASFQYGIQLGWEGSGMLSVVRAGEKEPE